MIGRIRERSANAGCLFLILLPGAALSAAWALWDANWVVASVAGAVALLAALMAYDALVVQPRLQGERLVDERSDYTTEHLFQHFESMGLRRAAIESGWEALRPWLPREDFQVMPGDSLESRFGMVVHEEIDDILKDACCREPTAEELARANSLRNVEEFFVLVDRLYTGEPQTWMTWYEHPLGLRDRFAVFLMLAGLVLLFDGFLVSAVEPMLGYDGVLGAAKVAALMLGSGCVAACLALAAWNYVRSSDGRRQMVRFGLGCLAGLLVMGGGYAVSIPLFAASPQLGATPGVILLATFVVGVAFLAVHKVSTSGAK